MKLKTIYKIFQDKWHFISIEYKTNFFFIFLVIKTIIYFHPPHRCVCVLNGQSLTLESPIGVGHLQSVSLATDPSAPPPPKRSHISISSQQPFWNIILIDFTPLPLKRTSRLVNDDLAEGTSRCYVRWKHKNTHPDEQSSSLIWWCPFLPPFTPYPLFYPLYPLSLALQTDDLSLTKLCMPDVLYNLDLWLFVIGWYKGPLWISFFLINSFIWVFYWWSKP